MFLEIGIKTLLVLSLVFFLIFSYFCLLWSGRKPDELKNILAASLVSLLHTFKILLVAFLLVLIVSLFLDKPFGL